MSSILMGSVPMGTIVAFVLKKEYIPPGWLLCDGATIPVKYSKLISKLGPNTPNLAGRTLIGTGVPNMTIQTDQRIPNFDTSNNWPLGYTGGEYQHKLVEDEIPQHTHDASVGWGEAGGTYWQNLAVVGGNAQTIKTDGGTGGGEAHFNMQPYQAVHYIIYTGLNN
jgi:microcystin-dependent protein